MDFRATDIDVLDRPAEVGRATETPSPTVEANSGGCRSCNCRGYIPNRPPNDWCSNCGHHWNNHA